MAYQLKTVTIRTRNTPEGMASIAALWQDVQQGRLPLLCNSDGQEGQAKLSPVSRYSNYESDETGEYDLSIMTVTPDFFRQMARKVEQGAYKLYDVSDVSGNLELCAQKAWQQVWDDTAGRNIKRSFTEDFESTVPTKFTPDGLAHCYLYIAVE